jgi:AcrR family transcriptional regulator
MSIARESSKKGEARERLLAAADELFYSEGVHTVGIDRVIAKAGVAKGSLYYIFGSKEELVRQYLENRHGRWTRTVADGIAGEDDPRARILAVFDVLDRLFTEPDYRGCTFMNATAEAPKGSVEQLGAKGFRDWLNGLFLGLAQDAKFVDPVAVGQQLVILYDGAVVVAQMDSTREPGQIAKGIARSLMDSDPAWQTEQPADS